VSPSKPVNRGSEPTEAQWRVIAAALKLFSEHGVGGTSLRMIASELGVTVAAVYHQYHTKNEIIFAALESELRRLKSVVDAAETESTANRAREALINGMVDLALGVGRSVSTILNDPVVTGSFDGHDGFRDLMHRIRVMLMGEANTQEARIRTATLMAAINGTATHPMVADLDDETLRSELLYIAHRLLPRKGAAG
jgi:AcrR family transcriptional regulator